MSFKHIHLCYPNSATGNFLQIIFWMSWICKTNTAINTLAYFKCLIICEGVVKLWVPVIYVDNMVQESVLSVIVGLLSPVPTQFEALSIEQTGGGTDWPTYFTQQIAVKFVNYLVNTQLKTSSPKVSVLIG